MKLKKLEFALYLALTLSDDETVDKLSIPLHKALAPYLPRVQNYVPALCVSGH